MLIDVIDSSDHMATGDVKDAWYLVSKIMLLMEEIDVKNELFDMIVFDGTANVQKAGQGIAVCLPNGTCWISFLVKDFKEAQLELLKTWTSIVSFYFDLYFIFPFMTIIAMCFL